MSLLGTGGKLVRAADAASTAGFIVGALYNRQRDIHGTVGGQWQSGIATPADSPYVVAFTGSAGVQHGYFDQWDDAGILHYFGEGQQGDMRLVRGNLALLDHAKNGRRLLLFQALGRGLPYRFLGEFRCLGFEWVPNIPDGSGKPRVAIVFKLQPLLDDVGDAVDVLAGMAPEGASVGPTVRQVLTTVRTKQDLFRRRLTGVERGCRLTGVLDLRFLRASHIKPWADSTDPERVDRNNGLLLTPSADLLFDHGWISFRDDGRLLVSDRLPDEVHERVGLDLTSGRACGTFAEQQAGFLAYHRDCVFGDRGRQERLDHDLLG